MFHHHVDAALAGDLADLGGNILLVVIDRVVGAEFARFGEFAFATGGSDDAALEELGDLYGGGADAAGSREHQDVLAGLEFGARHEHVPGGEKHQRGGGGALEAHVVGDLDGAILRCGEQFGIAAVDGVAEHGEAAAEVVVAQQALLALAATLSRREEDAPARLDALAEFACGNDLASDVAAQDVRHGELHAGDTGADEEVEVIEGAGANADQDLVGFDVGLRHVLVDKHFGIPVLVNAGCLHEERLARGGRAFTSFDSRNLGYFAIPQAWFSTGDAKPVRDLVRDLERVNRGRTLSEPFSPFESKLCIIHTCKEYRGAQLRSARCCSSRSVQKEDRKCNLRNLKNRSRLARWSSAGASLESAVSSSNPLIVIRCANGIRSILDSLTKAKA